MDDDLGMRSVSAPNRDHTDGKPGPVGDGHALLPDGAIHASTERVESDLVSSIMQSLLFWERIFAYQERGKPRRTNGDAECVEEAGSGTEGEPILE